MSRVLVIGAGASGLMAALTAARNNAEVTVFEHKSEAGIKLALTGNGRCNYTNTDAAADKYHGDEFAEAFVSKVLEHFGSEDTVRFFRELGIEPLIRHYAYDESGYVYPKDMNAVGFRDILLKAALDAGVKIYYGVEPDTLRTAVRTVVETGTGAGERCGCVSPGKIGCDKVGNPVFDVRDSTLKTSVNDDETYRGEVEYDSMIIATGSNAYPVTGSDSSIYPALKEAGIEMHRFLPALCALFSKDEYLKVMKGR
ncbi:MAG: NAD(P)/FAD-dependent oxidoreductase, partial [Eubacteriales bacterium]|nr:NAD(P)/FAD-dependent oxidoreductase [Eubacteriales bacterium]